MIHINFSIDNPWRRSRFYYLGNVNGQLTENKCWEIEQYLSGVIVEFEFNFTVRQDHAGCELSLGLLGYNIHGNFYDRRHWNTDTNSWKKYEDSI